MDCSTTRQRLPVSLVVVARNEEEKLAECLASCEGHVASMLVGDMGSTDRTAEIARAAGATVYELPEAGFADPARQFMTQQVTQPWILMLDADERATSALFGRIAHWVADDDLAAVELPRKNVLFGRWLRHSHYWPDYQIRLYRPEAVTWTPYVHTPPKVDGRTVRAPAEVAIALTHLNYETLYQWFEKANRYTTEEVRAPRHMTRRYRRSDLLVSPLKHFLHRYIAGRGFLDGRQGLWVAILMAIYAIQIELKRWEDAARRSRAPSDQPDGPLP